MKLFLFLLLPFSLFSQTDYPSDFISPLPITLDVSGSFGELRSNHFHSGIDLKTNGKEGLDVYAVADGYISRIKISSFGYGKAIYITHPNGFTTVYGHLQKANGAIETYIKQKQYAQKAFEVEMFPMPSELPVKKGDIIAFSGNSGGSGAPHLHFEFRDTKSEKIINPLYFGFNKLANDTRKPEIQGVIVYPIDSTLVNKSQKPIEVSFNKTADGNYLASKVIANGKIGFGINAFDYCTNQYNKNGLFKVKAYLNGVSYYEYELQSFAFDESRFVNSLIDYQRYGKLRQRVQKLFQEIPFPLSIVKANKTNGIIHVQPGVTYTYRVELFDFHGNKVQLTIPVEYGNQETVFKKEIKKTKYFLKSKNEYNYAKDNVSVYIPENTFYEDFYMDFDVKDGVLNLHDESVPGYKNMTITFSDVQGLTEEQLSKTFIATIDGYKLDYNKTYRKGNSFKLYTRNLGKYKLSQDYDAPRIYNVNFVEGKNLKNQTTISVYIADNLSGIDTYNAYLNGEWILMEYDYKTKKLIHRLDEKKYKEGRNDLKIIVTDDMQNSTTFESFFFMNN
ncbi:MAG: M23 family metallopeptidase [Flavobacterium sp.]|jgi:murein DD-endopeptidase MepM/ murein hydrolase activator NlpD